MDKLTSILVVAHRTVADRALLDKAVLLARSVGAQILLFSCDAALAKAIQHTHSSEDAEKSRQIALDERLAYLESTLPDFAARHHYDALILGGLTHRRGIAPLIGTLTGKLVETLDTDFILVKRGVAVPAERTHPENRASSVGSSVVGQALFGD